MNIQKERDQYLLSLTLDELKELLNGLNCSYHDCLHLNNSINLELTDKLQEVIEEENEKKS